MLAIAEWTQDADRDMLSRIGIAADQAMPSESTMRRTLALLDANDLDARLAGWMATRVGHLAGRRVIAVDGKTMRAWRAYLPDDPSGSSSKAGVPTPVGKVRPCSR